MIKIHKDMSEILELVIDDFT